MTESKPSSASGVTFSSREFSSLPLHPSLQNALKLAGFSHCTAIQADSLDTTMEGGDLLGQSQTGTGKTAAFLVSIMNKCLSDPRKGARTGWPRSLVIAPTRELALQIYQDALLLSKGCDFRTVRVIGGEDMEKQKKKLEAGPCDLLIGTPGRLLDWQGRGVLHLKTVDMLVLDEADRLLDMGFLPSLRRLVGNCLPIQQRQTMMFSATFSTAIKNLARNWQDNPIHVSVASRLAAETVQQMMYLARSDDRLPFMKKLLKREENLKVLVFANRRHRVRDIFDSLRQSGINCAMLSGEMAQQKRLSSLKRFREGKLTALIATDVAGRGLHVEGVTHVINYDLPEDPEQYVHRIGRTGRIGNSGVSISFATEEQAFLLPAIEKFLGEAIPCEPLPLSPAG